MNLPSRDLRAKLIRVVAIIAFVYVLAIGLLVVGESSMLFRPFDGPSNPADAGLGNYHVKTLTIEGQVPIVYWENDAPADAPTVLYFHGNAGGLYLHKHALKFFDDAKLHAIAMEYPGYPGAQGDPSEEVLVNDAIALYDTISKTIKQKPAIWGYSLGTGVAVQLAAARDPSSLVLEAPFTSVVDRAGELFPYAPVDKLMKNKFLSRNYISKVHAPLFIMHGTDDTIIPIAHGKKLFALANEPKQFKAYEGAGHLNLFRTDAYKDADSFIRTYDQATTREHSSVGESKL